MRDRIATIVGERVDPERPGVAVAVVHHGDVAHRAGYGYANLEWGQPITPDTVFGIGSTTKPFTATAILLLERDGKLHIDGAITNYLPSYDTHGAHITLRHLLTHTSGIPNFVTQPNFFETWAPLDLSHHALRKLFEPLPLDFAPGTRYSYSNSGYCLLGMIIEAASGMSYEEFVRTRIFEPLGMRRSYYMRHDALIPHRAGGYQAGDHGYLRAPHRSETLIYAAGALGATLDDLICWDRALCDNRLLDASTRERMWTRVRLVTGRTEGYGLGWGLSTYRGRRVVHHAGGVAGFSAFFGRFVDDDLAIIVLSNQGGFDCAGLARPISNLVLGLPTPTFTPIARPHEDAARIVGSYRGLVETLDVTCDGEQLVASGDVRGELLPVSERRFVLADNADVSLSFEDEHAGRFQQVRVVVPFYWFNAWRTAEPAS